MASQKVEPEGDEGQFEEFHPTETLMQTMDVVTRNMEAAG
jgi:hypothetical protein